MNTKIGKGRMDCFSSIRTRMLVYFGLLFVVMVTLLGLSHIYGIPFTGFEGEYVDEQKGVLKKLYIVADLKKERIENFLQDIRNDISIFSKNKFVVSDARELNELVRQNIENGMNGGQLRLKIMETDASGKLSRYLSMIDNTYENYDKTLIFDFMTGMILACADGKRIGADFYAETHTYDNVKLDRDVLENDFKSGGPGFHLVRHETEGHIDFGIYSPVRDGDRIVAVLMIDINTDNVIVPLLHTGGGQGESGEALLVDNNGMLLMPSKHTLPDGTVPEPLKFIINARPAVLASQGEEGMILSKDYRGIDVLAAYRYIRLTSEKGWGMVVKEDSSEAFAELNENIKYSIIIGLINSIIFGAFIIFIIKDITKPIIKLSEYAGNIGRGNLDMELHAESRDEVGRLTEDFNDMRLKLKEFYTGLEEKVREKTNELAEALEHARDRNIRLSETRDAMLNLVEDLEVEVAEHKRAREKIKNQLENLNALRKIDLAITSSLDLGVILNIFLDQVINQLHADAADVMILDQDAMMLNHAASKGFMNDKIKNTSMGMGEGYAGYVALEREMLYELDLSNISTKCKRSYLLEEEMFRTYFGIPLIAKGSVKGVLEVFHRTPFQPDNEWYGFLESLAGQAAIAIDNSMMFDEVQRSRDELLVGYESTIEGWARALDYRDRETEGHSRRVTNITLRIAAEMGIDSAQLTHIRRGALLHDIGKLGVPDHILFKPSELDADEWKLMRLHPLIANEILSPIPFLRPALDIPNFHHEKWDGSGYPRGLKGDAIPIAARIFAIVDVWDALISDRPYRLAWSKEAAKEHLRSEAGTHFDPEIVEVFLKMEL